MARVLGVVCGIAAALLMACAAPAKASLITGGYCPGATTAFAQWGDPRFYVFGQNGGLEQGSAGWSLSGAGVVPGNEAYYLHSRSDNHSLLLLRGGTALTPAMCMGTSSTVVRFFVRGDADLRVQVVERNLLGFVIGILDATTIQGTNDWQPSPAVVNLDSLQGLIGVSSVQLRLTAIDGQSLVDDVYVDPWGSSDSR